jgi:SAM-dependent methyltransferase
MSVIGDVLYPLHAGIHWTPRMEQLREAIAYLRKQSCFERLIDIGCGHGLLFPEVRDLDLKYTGIDTCEHLIDVARRKYSEADFQVTTAESLPIVPNSRDIAIFNGVVHHLSPEVWSITLSRLTSCGAIVVLDHRRDEEFAKKLMLLPRLLQWADRGKFIRDYSHFNELEGFSAIWKKSFEIEVLGIRAWPYFCFAYLNKQILVAK